METNLKLSSLQQHYKLLKSQNDDNVEECKKIKATQLEEINSVQSKVKLLHSQNEQTIKQWDKDIKLWKVNLDNKIFKKKFAQFYYL